MAQHIQSKSRRELEGQVGRTCSDIVHVTHLIANEPSMAMFRVEQHVQKTIPHTTKISHTIQQANENLKGRIHDTEYANEAVSSLKKSEETFKNIEDLLRRSTSMAAILKMKKEQKSHLL